MTVYAIGTVAVTNGSATITGTGTAWAANVAAGALFTIRQTGVVFQVGSVTDDDTIVLTAPYGGATASGLAYVISTNFTPIFSLPVPEPGDIEVVAILKEQISRVEALLKAGVSPAYNEPVANFTLDATTHRGSINKCSAGVTAILLPPAASVEIGWRAAILPAASITVNRQGSDTIDGGASAAVASNKWVSKTAAGVFKTYAY